MPVAFTGSKDVDNIILNLSAQIKGLNSVASAAMLLYLSKYYHIQSRILSKK